MNVAADLLRAGFDRHANTQPCVGGVRALGDALPSALALGLAADGAEEDPPAVDADLDLMRSLEAADRLEVGAEQRQ